VAEGSGPRVESGAAALQGLFGWGRLLTTYNHSVGPVELWVYPSRELPQAQEESLYN